MPNLFQKMEFDVVQSEDGKSMYVDVDLQTHLARVTIMRMAEGAGACDVEVIDVGCKETTLWQHHEFSSSAELDALLTDFWGRLRDLPGAADDSAEPPIITEAFELPLQDKRVELEGVLGPLLAVAPHT